MVVLRATELVEGSWRVRGGFVEGSWKVRGKFVEGSWKVHGRFVEGSWKVRDLGRVERDGAHAGEEKSELHARGGGRDAALGAQRVEVLAPV